MSPGRLVPLEIWKFGGASLADSKAVDHAASLIAAHSGPLVVVASALAGITDLLLAGVAHAAARQDGDAHAAANVFARRHRQLVNDLVSAGQARQAINTLIDQVVRELLELCGAAAAMGGLAPDASDLVVTDPVQAGVMAVMAIADTARFSIDRLTRRTF